MSEPASGSRRTPHSNASKPITNCRYWLTKNSEPNRAKNTSVMAPDAALNRALANRRTSRRGCDERRSHNTNATSRTTAETSEATITGSPQPVAGPSMMP